MATTEIAPTSPDSPTEAPVEKGLKSNALSLASNVVIGVASTAPAYSLAATLGLIVVAVGVLSPTIVVLAFIPMLLISFAYKELNYADPDCGTTFTWGTRAFGPKTGWFGGWGIVAADILVMASLAQIAGQYVFLLFGANGIGENPASTWVLLVGILWIVAMTTICYIGIEISANMQKVLLGIELTILILFSVVALVKVGTGNAPAGHLTPSAQWFNPFHNMTFTSFMVGFTLMLFIYWGWDTSVSVNEETKDSRRTPGRAAVISTLILLATYALVVMASQSYAGIGTHGLGLGNPDNSGDIFKVLGGSVFGSSGIGWFMTKLLLLMVLSSAAASTQTTILPTARTTLSMATYKAIPSAFARVHKRFLTPTVSTVAMGLVSIALYIAMNYLSNGSSVIGDSVTALGAMIAFYYGLTGFACVWYWRKTLTSSTRNLWMRGILPLLGAVILWFAMFWFLWYNWVTPSNSYTTWTIPGTDRVVGGVIILDVAAIVLGVVLFFVYWAVKPDFFRGRVLNRDTPTLVPDDLGTPVGLFGIEPGGPGNGGAPGTEGAGEPETTSS